MNYKETKEKKGFNCVWSEANIKNIIHIHTWKIYRYSSDKLKEETNDELMFIWCMNMYDYWSLENQHRKVKKL